MKRSMLMAAATAALLSGTVFAAPFYLDDSGVDYTQRSEDTDVEVAYMSLDLLDGRLQVRIDDEPSPAALPAIDFVIPDLDREDLFGREFNANLDDIVEVRRVKAGNVLTSLDVRHPDVSVRELAAHYRQSLERLGYAVQVNLTPGTGLARIVAEHEDGILRIQLARSGTDVRAHVGAF